MFKRVLFLSFVILCGVGISGLNLRANAAASACVSLVHNLASGSRDSKTGGEVTKLQNFLAKQGFLTDSGRGLFGKGTQKAVISFQKSVGLTQSGNVYSQTRAKIKEISCGIAAVPTPTPIPTASVAVQQNNGPTPTRTPISTGPYSVTSPREGDQLSNNQSGNITTIKWVKGRTPGTVTLTLMDTHNQLVKIIASDIDDTGSYVWPIDQSLTSGQYVIHIVAQDKTTYTYSGIFALNTY